jgi:EAL domain-containing protein (putative c-di-GMP-specific phosphodiesterase class I)
VEVCRQLGIADIHEATNGQEALSLLEHLQPELLVVDLEMPTMDGPQLLSQLRARRIDIPIVLASSQEVAIVKSVQHLGKALGLTILGTLQKPLSAPVLLEMLCCCAGPTASAAPPGPQLSVDEDSLRKAIESGQLTTHYQPQIELNTGAVRSVEALVRWAHPQAGLIGPEFFIPVAERCGLIGPLTLRVLNEAALQLTHWRGADLELSVAVNLSPVLLGHPRLVEEISSVARTYDLPPQNLILEVTETGLFDQAAGLEVLTRLRLRGFGLSLDDYGTGYSSLQQLAQIPFTELKIDRSFVHGVASQQKTQVMLRSAVAMARELGLATVAEGVESPADLEFLHQCGCTFGQGWLFCKALPPNELTAWLKSRQCAG